MVTNSNHLKQGSWWDLTSEIKVGAKSKLFVIVDNFYCRSASSQFTVLSQPCVLHSVPGASASSDMERCQRLPILCRKKPKRTVKLSFDKLPWLFNRLVFLLLMLLVVFMVTLLYLFGTLLPVSLLFCTMCFCVCDEGGCLSFETRERAWGGCMRAVWVLQRVSDREKSERDAQHLPKKTVFLVGMPVEFRNHAITIWKDSLSLLPSHSRSHSPRLNVLLSDWALRFFSCNSLLDQTQCVDLNMLLNCIRLAQQHTAKNIKQKCACTLIKNRHCSTCLIKGFLLFSHNNGSRKFQMLWDLSQWQLQQAVFCGGSCFCRIYTRKNGKQIPLKPSLQYTVPCGAVCKTSTTIKRTLKCSK